MTSVIDPKTIGKPVRPRRHVRTLTGMFVCLYA
jgi:starch phosphorylase